LDDVGWRSNARLPAIYRISSRCGVAAAAAVGLSCKWKQSVSILGLALFLFPESCDDDVNDSTTNTSNAMVMTTARGSSQLKQHNMM
jgi:phage terminase large subunit-like protein